MGDGAVEEEELPEPVRLDVNVDAYVPADYIPYEQAKVDVHRRIAGAREVAELAELRDELEDRFGAAARAAGEPHHAPAGAHQARPGRRARGHLPPGPARRHADRARLRAGQAAARGDPGRALRVRPVAALGARARRSGRALPGRRAGRGRAARLLSRCLSLAEIDPLPSVRVMMKTKLCILALGAFFVPAALVAGCGGVPGNAVAEVDGTAIKKDDFDHWMNVAAEVRRPGRRGGAQAARTTRRASRRSARRTPKPAKGQPKVTDAQLKTQCKQEYDALRDQVLQLLISLRVDRGRGQGAGHQGHRRGGQEVVRQAEEAGVPEGRRLREVPQGLGPDRGGHPPARPPRHALQQDPREGDQGQGQGHRRPDRRRTTTRTSSASPSPSGATCGSS